MTKLYVPKDNFDQNLIRYLLEKNRTKPLHPADLKKKEAALRKNNPFHPSRQKASTLTVEVPRLYAAVAFAMWQYGAVMNAHLTICWRLLGITHHAKAAELLSLYNHEAAKWLDVGMGDGVERSRITRRSSGTSEPHVFVYVHENARDKGFHTHELVCLPVSRAQAFADWSRDCLARLAGKSKVDEAAVFFSPASAKLQRFKPYGGARENFPIERQWTWFRYITKSLQPDHMERALDGGLRLAREIFGITNPFIETPPVTCGKLAGYSENIGPAMQRRVGFVSKFDKGDWANLYNGSELDEFWEREAAILNQIREAARQAEMKALLDRITI